ncbi:MAG: sulfatase-like hydrolase/transferase, partial [Angelakisella sp.]
DHYHYFEQGGEGYHTLFDTWELERGQEQDPWRALITMPDTPKFVGKNNKPYWANRAFQNTENDEDYPTPRCFADAIDFLKHNSQAEDWHLHLELFDPHEPFACPQKYRDSCGDQWDNRYHFDWPFYAPVQEPPEAVEHIRKSYAAVVTMADVWLGKLLDTMDELDLWKDTALIFTTDHGYLLGEHGYWAKNYMMAYRELVHIPLILCTPQTAFSGRRVKALTASIDLMPTLLELHGAQPSHRVQGKSLLPLLEQEQPHHDAVLYGSFGRDINLFNGRYTYCCQPEEGSTVYCHTAAPGFFEDYDRTTLANAELGCFLRDTQGIAQYRIAEKSRRYADSPEYNVIYDLCSDPGQTQPIRDPALERQLVQQLKELLLRYDAPACQFIRCPALRENPDAHSKNNLNNMEGTR